MPERRRLHAADKQITRGMIAHMRRMKGMLLLAAVPCALCGLNRAARAQTDLSPIVVIATRVAESSFDVPASVDRVIPRRSRTARFRSTSPSR